MQNFFKKHIVGILAVILVTAIAVLAFAAFAPKAKEDDPIKNMVDTSLNTPEPPEEQEPTIPYYESVIPKSSNPSETYLYEQSICANGNVSLCTVLQTTSATYIIAETDAKSGDIYGEKPTVGIIKCDSLGNISKTYSLRNTCDYRYVSACISNLGLVVIATDSAKNYLYVTVTDYELTQTETKITSYADDVALYPTNESFLIFTDNGAENFIIKYTEKELLFSTVNSGKIVDVFDFGTFYRIFYNASSGYGATDVDSKDFSTKKDIFVSNATLKCIIPLVENGQQVYVAIENENGVYARKYYSDLVLKNAERKKIGTAEILGHGTDGQNIYLCVGGGLSGIITLKSDLTFSYSLNKTDTVTAKIQDFNFGHNFFLLVTDLSDRLALITMDGESCTVNYFATTDKALLITYPNGTIAIAYNSPFYDYSSINIIGIK